MAALKFGDLKKLYYSFSDPVADVYVDGDKGRIGDNTDGIILTDVEVENTSGFEASMASYTLRQVYDVQTAAFKFDKIKSYITLGSPVTVYMGYRNQLKEVFRGFISNTSFEYPKGDIPLVRVTALDIKGLMMSGTYSKQLKANKYSEAVSEILKRTNYEKLKSGSGNGAIVKKLNVEDTPDDPANEDSDLAMEMVAESDYEFVVRAAKKFNFEFFTYGGIVNFRKAKSDKASLMEIGMTDGVNSFQADFGINSLVESVEVRNVDVGMGKLVSEKKKLNNKISTGSKAKALIAGIEKVYIDPTVRTKADAGYRADYIVDEISYRYGSMRLEMLGIPDFEPGKFVTLTGFGKSEKVNFYVTEVIHRLSYEFGYETVLIGKTNAFE